MFTGAEADGYDARASCFGLRHTYIRKSKVPRKKPFAAEALANALFPQPLPRRPLIASSTSRPLWWNW